MKFTFKLLFSITIVITLYLLSLRIRRNLSAGRWANVKLQTKEIRKNGTNVAIVVIVDSDRNENDYQIAHDSVRCYAEMNDYKLYYIDYSKNKTLQKLCPDNEFLFTRHCVMAQILDDNLPEQFYLFLDADIGVINPERSIEEFLPVNPSTHLVFYQRFYNSEIMAGSYLVRKSRIGRDFLRYWAWKYENISSTLAFSGMDNGALHSAVVDFFLPEMDREREICENTWKTARGLEMLFDYESCIQYVITMANTEDRGFELIEKGEAWARDGWLTGTKWCGKDLFFHGWKKEKMGSEWILPFADEQIFKENCVGSAVDRWRYNQSLRCNCEEIEEKLSGIFNEKQKDHLNRLSRLRNLSRLPDPLEIQRLPKPPRIK